MTYVFETQQEAVAAYDESLDTMQDPNGVVNVCGFMFTPSRILKKCDPIAYRYGFVDWLDGYITDGEVPKEAEGWSVDV